MGELIGGLFQQMKSRNDGRGSSLLNEMHRELICKIYNTRKEVEFSR